MAPIARWIDAAYSPERIVARMARMARWIDVARWMLFPGKRVPPVEVIWFAIFVAFLGLLLFILFNIGSFLGFFGFSMFCVFAPTALKASLRRRRASRSRSN